MVAPGTVYLVGAGPGDPGLITRRGLDILRAADVVVYDRLVNRELLLEARSDARLIYVGKSPGRHSLTQDEINLVLASEAGKGHSVCRLKGGDPFLFGRGGEEADHLVESGIPFVVVPGVTSALAAPAYAGIPVTDRRVASTLAVATGHEDPDKTGSTVNWGALAQAADTIVVLMGMKNLAEITRQLMSTGRDGATPAAAVRWGTTGRQQVLVSDLAHIAEEATRRDFAAPAVLVIGPVVELRKRLAWFDQRPLSGLRVLVPRPPHQASRLAELLRAAGAEPFVCPLIRVEPIPAEADRLRSLVEQQWNWVLFTSANGITWFGRQLHDIGLDWRSLAGGGLGAIGPGTACALEDLGLRVDFVPTRAVAESFAEELPGISSASRVLLCRAAEARDVLPDALRRKGARVEVVDVYRTVPDEQGVSLLKSALDGNDVDIAAFTSSSMVRNVVTALSAEALKGCRVACIGPITARTARDCGLTVDIEAETHTMPGLVTALEEYFEAGRTRSPRIEETSE